MNREGESPTIRIFNGREKNHFTFKVMGVPATLRLHLGVPYMWGDPSQKQSTISWYFVFKLLWNAYYQLVKLVSILY